jgi:hypothetical protein
MFLTDLVVISQPLMAHGMGSKDTDNLFIEGWNGLPIRPSGFEPTPIQVPRSSHFIRQITSRA